MEKSTIKNPQLRERLTNTLKIDLSKAKQQQKIPSTLYVDNSVRALGVELRSSLESIGQSAKDQEDKMSELLATTADSLEEKSTKLIKELKLETDKINETILELVQKFENYNTKEELNDDLIDIIGKIKEYVDEVVTANGIKLV